MPADLSDLTLLHLVPTAVTLPVVDVVVPVVVPVVVLVVDEAAEEALVAREVEAAVDSVPTAAA